MFKSAATEASPRPGPWHDWFTSKVPQGMRPPMVRLTLARKLAAATLAIWKNEGRRYNDDRLKSQAA